MTRAPAVLPSVLMSVLPLLLAAPSMPVHGAEPSAPREDLTERSDLWSCGAECRDPAEATLRVVTGDGAVVGERALALDFARDDEHYLVYPKWRNAGWDLSGTGFLEFRVRKPDGRACGWPTPTLFLRRRDGPVLRIRPTRGRHVLARDGWRTIRIPLRGSADWEVHRFLGMTLDRVDFLELAFFGGTEDGEGRPHTFLVDGVRFSTPLPAYDPPDETAGDLDVLIIERAPLYERYQVVDFRRPRHDTREEVGVCRNRRKQHEPRPGETVTFTARVKNKGRDWCGGWYAWLLDGKEVETGILRPIGPRVSAGFTWTWSWDPSDHDLTFRIRPGGEDFCPDNDSLTVRTNALQLKFRVEAGLVPRVEAKVNMLGSRSLEDWLQGQVRFMNQRFARSVYDFAPRGITQRVAVGGIQIVKDGGVEAMGDGPHLVGEKDLRYDGGLGYATRDDAFGNGPGGAAFLNFVGRPDGAWIRELGRQIGVIDLSRLEVPAERNRVNGVAFGFDRAGIMGGGDTWPHPVEPYALYSPGTVAGLEATRFRRRGYSGDYLYNVPSQCTLVVLDPDGRPVREAKIRMYQTRDGVLDDRAEHVGTTDGRGRMPIPNVRVGPFETQTGCVLRDNPFGAINLGGTNGVFLVTVEDDEVTVEDDARGRLGFISLTDFNLPWARGQRDRAEIPVVVRPRTDERRYVPVRPFPAEIGD